MDEVCGIEANGDLCKISRKNMEKLGVRGVRVIRGDATAFQEGLDRFNYFYFYNPFRGATFRSVVGNIVASINREPRVVTIVYNTPVDRATIDETRRFEVVGRYSPFLFPATEYLIYKSK